MVLCPNSQLGAAYVSATTGAVVTALGLKSLTTVTTGLVCFFLPVKMTPISASVFLTVYSTVCASLSSQRLPPIVSRFVPFAAVAAANCINIPFMRQR